MEGKSNVSSFGGSNSARHLMTHNKHHDGVEAPRNSLDLPLETANRHHVINENFMVKIPSPEMNLHHKGSTPVKLLINEEVTNRENNKRNGPSVVARLMGMDTLPPEKGQIIHVKECFDENPRKHIARVPRFVSTKSEVDTPSSTTFTQSKEQLPMKCNKQQNSSSSTKSLSSTKSHRREHPQEELLQKFKKEFESWQASKLWECSSNLDQNNSSQRLKNEQNLALENLNLEKMTRHANSNRYLVQKKPIETDVHTAVNKVKIASNQVDGLCHDANLDKQCVPRMKDEMTMRKLASNSFEPVSRAKFQEKKSRSCSPTRIVILKPSSDINEIEEPPSDALEKGNSMEHFLEEVKERLRLEMEGKGRNDSVRRGNAAHTSLHERSTDPKQLARDIAKHIRESVTRDLGETSVRSESTRSFSNDFHVNEQESQDSIKKDTRKFISDRLKNVLKDDTEFEKLMFNDGRVGNSLLIKEKERSKSMTDFSKEGKGASFWEDKKAVNESIPKYLRWEQVKLAEFDADAMSPPNLIRSFSAPASGTSFGKLLLEDHGVATRAQISRKHETSENDSSLININKKDGFNFKGKVSIFRRNLSFKGKFFGKKMSSMGESTSETFSYLKSIETMPSVIRNFGMVEDNSTEVPPSPASFYSSPSNEHHSPVSPLEVPFVEDHSSTQVSGELSMSLLESGNLPEQIESKVSEEVVTEAQLNDINEKMHIESHAKSYVRDILIVSGLYKDWPLNQTLSRLDGQIESISSYVFDEVEEKNYKPGKVEVNCCKLGDIDMDRKLLFDLVNEALPTVIDSPMTPLMSKRWKESLTQLPCGIKLLDDLFHQIKIYANVKVAQHQSIDKVVAWDVKLRPWFTSSYEDIGFIEKEVEGLIIGDLIDELVSDLSWCQI